MKMFKRSLFLSALQSVLKTAFIFAIVFAFSFTTSSCALIRKDYHLSRCLNQTDIFFEDNDGNKYFENGASGYFCGYTEDAPNYYIGKANLFREGSQWVNYSGGVANSKYLFTLLCYPSDGGRHCFARIFDKSFNVVKTITFENALSALDLTCTENYLYIYLKNGELNTFSLLRYSVEFDSLSTLIDSTSREIEFYRDDDVHLFFNKNDWIKYVGKYGTKKTRLLSRSGHYFTDKIDLSFSNNDFIIKNDGDEHRIKSNFSLFSCHFYSKVYLIDNQLVFGIYSVANSMRCYRSEWCICSLRQSYLYKYDLGLNELTLIKEFEKGTFLIDYDLDGYKYYYNGGLYINGELFRECENLEPVDDVNFEHTHNSLEFNLCCYNGEFYGL